VTRLLAVSALVLAALAAVLPVSSGSASAQSTTLAPGQEPTSTAPTTSSSAPVPGTTPSTEAPDAVAGTSTTVPAPAADDGWAPAVPSGASAPESFYEGRSSVQFVGAPWFQPGTVYTQNFPDPNVVFDPESNLYYAFATTTGGVYVPVMSSPDLVTWTARSDHSVPNPNGMLNDALPDPSPPSMTWTSGDPRFPDELWAPSATKMGSRWVLFYALVVADSGRHCIYYATSDQPEGPYLSPQFLTCSDDPLGSIDPEPFTDPVTGATYLLWQDQGVVGSHGQRLFARQITMTSPTTVAWAPGSLLIFLLESQNTWERWVAENPSMVRLDSGALGLFYSGGLWNSDSYSVGLAVCPELSFSWTPICTRTSVAPLMSRRQGDKGIGGSSAFRGRDGELHLANHYWDDQLPAAYPQNQRRLRVDQVYTVGGRLMISNEPGPSGPSSPGGFQPVAPVRVLDTRDGTGTSTVRPLEAGEVVVLDLSSRVPGSATAVTLNLTIDGARGSGFVTAFACGRPPDASNMNYTVGQVVPELVTVQLNAARKVCLYVHAATDLVADLQGSYTTQSPSGFTGVAPTRVVDTRDAAPVGAGSVLAVQVVGDGLPAPTGATAVAVSLTADRAGLPGYLTAYACGTQRPLASSANYVPGVPASNAVLAPVSPDGQICIYSQRQVDVILDVFGYVDSTGDPFTAQNPVRVLDTRTGAPVAGGQVTQVQVVGQGRAPVGTTSVVLTVTGVDARAPGWVGAFACATPPVLGMLTSNLNLLGGETRAAHVTVPVGPDGKVCLRTSQTTHLLADLAGSYS